MKKQTGLKIILPSIGMLILILDSATALSGATEGIELCLRTVVPSLFPFFVMTILLTSAIRPGKVSVLAPLRKLCGFPGGAESLLIIGLLGGYPVGAQSVCQCFSRGSLTKKQAQRLLGFCSNAGPAFLFGIVGTMFPLPSHAWCLWGIHIVSAVAVGCILPGKEISVSERGAPAPETLPSALVKSVRIMASVCGWIVLMRVLIAFISRWFLWMFPEEIQAVVVCILELANGCQFLGSIVSVPTRYVLCAGALGFGGLCVYLQTVSVTAGLGTGQYLPGKLLQAAISILLSWSLTPLLFREHQPVPASLAGILCIICLTGSLLLMFLKKPVAFSAGMVYNGENAQRSFRHAVPKKN